MKRYTKRIILTIITLITIITLGTFNKSTIVFATENIVDNEIQVNKEQNEFVYLSDIQYQSAQVAWKTVNLDKTSDNTSLCLKVEGSNATFKKGVFAHATSTIIYDISNYDYDYFSTYYGVSAHMGKAGSVKFYIYTSVDGTTWDLETEENPEIMTGSSEAKYVKIPIQGKKYLKLYADSNGDNGKDHSLYADAKLFKEGYSDNVTKSVEEYDELIRTKYEDNNKTINDEIKLLILQRELVKKAGNYQLKTLFEEGENYKNTFNWLFNDLEMLSMYIMGGSPDGSYLESFKTLTSLYENYKEDLENNSSDVYKKMIISLSLSHSKKVDFWIYSVPPAGEATPEPPPNVSNAVVRYQIYKDLLEENKLDSEFPNLAVEEMRYIMASQINDDEIKWMNSYAESKGNRKISGYSYINYKNVNTALYRSEEFFADDISKYEEKYKLTGFDVKNEKYYPRLWMIMEIGGVCWQISNVGQNAVSSIGLPSLVVGQPGHSAYLVRRTDNNGNGIWEIWNDVGGWKSTNLSAYSGTKGYYPIRLLNGWGNGSYTSSNPGTYILLGQAAMNDYDNYVKAKEKVLLANSYEGDKEEQETLYREALSIQSFNLDAWLGLIKLYTSDTTKKQEELYELAKEVAEALKYYPLPMHDLLRLINTKITDGAYMAAMVTLENKILTEASTASSLPADRKPLQVNVVEFMARSLLGTLDSRIATFSFDGENAETIVLANRYASNSTWDYSLDGGATWKTVDAESKKLSSEEIAQINTTDNIKVHIIGVNYDEENIYTIPITKGVTPSQLYNNDLENKVIGVTNNMEWRIVGDTDEWTLFEEKLPDLTGVVEVEVRNRATGTQLVSDSVKFSFTQDIEDNKHTYVPIDDISVKSFSSENVRANRGEHEYARNVIDGNLYTHWHTSRTATNDERFIVLELAEEKYISKIQIVPIPNYNYGIIKNAEIYTSLDGENWTKVKDVVDLPRDYEVKDIEITPVKTKYIKLKVTQSYDYVMKSGADYFASIAMLNLFEDVTQVVAPTVDLVYSTREITNENVKVQLINPSTEITITNNNGEDEYTFTENGEFTFEIEDQNGIQSKITAIVDWIDKEIPVATVKCDIKTITSGDVTAEVVVANISFNEEVTLLKDIPGLEKNEEDGTYTYVFENKLGFCLEFEDMAGNKGQKEVAVDWIDNEMPEATISYSIVEPTNKDVIAKINFNKNVTILNSDIKLKKVDDRNFTYTFTENGTFCIEFSDQASNIGEVILTVDWIKEETSNESTPTKVENSTKKNKKSKNKTEKNQTKNDIKDNSSDVENNNTSNMVETIPLIKPIMAVPVLWVVTTMVI